MDPVVERRRAARATEASRAHLRLALVCSPVVAVGAGVGAGLARWAVDGPVALALAALVLSGPAAAVLLRWSARRALEGAAVVAAREAPVAGREAPVAAPPMPVLPARLTPAQRRARELLRWRESPFSPRRPRSPGRRAGSA